MRKGFLGSLIALVAATAMGLAQTTSVQQGKVDVAAGNQGSSYSGPPQGAAPTMPGPEGAYPAEGPGCPSCNGNGAGCGDGEPDCSKYQFYTRGEYILWHIDNTRQPPLLANTLVGVASVNVGGTTSTLPVLAQATFGTPGGAGISFRDQPGARLTAGYWLDDQHCGAIEVSGFFLATRNMDLNSDTGQNLLSFPFSFMIPGFTGTTPPPSILTLDADARLHTSSSVEMWGTEVQGRCGKVWIGSVAIEGFGGFRYINLEEDFTSPESISLVGIPGLSNLPLIPTPAGFAFTDDIHTRNQFYGAQLGGTIDWCWHCFFLNLTGKVGLGDMHQAVDLLGNTVSLTPPVTVTPGGLVTSADDLGHHSRDRCCVLTEGGVNFGYNFGCHLRAFVGYNALFLSSVARPPDQVSFARTNLQVTVNNTPQSINVISPGFRFSSTDVTVQGCNFGLEFRY
jgi:hypothetical protein